MSTYQRESLQDLSHWMKAFENQKKELDQQIQQFDALQQEMQALVAQAVHSPKAGKKLEQVKSLENNTDYIQLRDRALEQIVRLEQQFSKLADGDEALLSSRSVNRGQEGSGKDAPPLVHSVATQKTVRGFV